MGIEEIIVRADIWRYIEVFSIFLMALGAGVFGWKQLEINRRIKKLNDYVAISIIPQQDLRLQIRNAGKINLYIHKWEAGDLNGNYKEPILIPVGGISSIIINLNKLIIGEHNFKMYIIDQRGEKYISTGKIFIDPISIAQQPPSIIKPEAIGQMQEQKEGAQIQTMVKVNLRAYSYKTEKYKWNI